MSVPKEFFNIPVKPTNAFVALPERGRPGGSSSDIQYFKSVEDNSVWIGKCGQQALEEFDYTLECKEALALKLYNLLSVRTPNIVFSMQPLSEETQENLPETPDLDEPRLHIMSQYLNGFTPLGKGFIASYKQINNFEQGYYCVTHNNKRIPLKGLGKALAIAGFLHDYDCIGNEGGNMGYIIAPNAQFAEVVKIDGGEALPFNLILDENIQHDPNDRQVKIGTTSLPFAFKDLGKCDQEEFIQTTEAILAFSDENIRSLFQQEQFINAFSKENCERWSQLLMARRHIFIRAYAPEVLLSLEQKKITAEQKKALDFAKYNSTRAQDSKQDFKVPAAAPLDMQFQLAVNEYIVPEKRQILVQAKQLAEQAAVTNANPNHFQLPARKMIVGRKECLSALENHFLTNKFCCLHGLGGIGKTLLAVEYLYQAIATKKYDQVIWLYAEHGQLLDQISLLVETWCKVKEPNQEALVKRFYEFLNTKKTCLVIDNVLDQNSLKGYLPPEASTVHVLTTSRQHWKTLPSLLVPSFTLEETSSYLSQYLQQIDSKMLAEFNKILGGLPLAVSQAAAYMKQKGIGLSQYMDLFLKSPGILFGDTEGNINTLSITLTLAIAQLRAVDKTSEKLLYLFGYLSSEHITFPLVQSLAQMQDVELQKSLDTLQSYSLITQSGNQLLLSSLTQKLLRLLDEQKGRAHEHYTLVLTWLLSQLNFDKTKMLEIDRVEGLLPHAVYLLELSASYNKVTEKKITLLEKMGSFYFYQKGRAEEGRRYLEMVLELRVVENRKPDLAVATTLVNLGNIYGALKAVDKQQALLERALTIQKETLGPKHPTIALTLTNLGNVYAALKKPQEQKQVLELALQIKEEHYGKNHVELANTLINLANAMGELKRPKEKKALLEKALVIQEQTYGKEHLAVATTLFNLGIACNTLGYIKEGVTFLERALPIFIKGYGQEHTYVAQTIKSLAHLNKKLSPQGQVAKMGGL
jgi:tetratricopeptide (TPR) repeat protein